MAAVPFITFVSILIYGSSVITPNHRTWTSSNPNPTGLQWFDHHVDRMLPAYETYLSDNFLPPLLPWDGAKASPLISTPIPIPPALQNPQSLASEEDLGSALADFYDVVKGQASEIAVQPKDAFSYRYWGYVKWAWELRERFRHNTVIPQPVIYDRDGTILSPVPFIDVFNDLHQAWHLGPVCSPLLTTPLFPTAVGQKCKGTPTNLGTDFIDFHRDHLIIFNRWLARTDQPPITAINMVQGWPRSADTLLDPSLWTEPAVNTWINDHLGDTDGQLQAFTSVEQIGQTIEGGFHGTGHVVNSDIAPLDVNNFSPRFFSWHSLIDHQRYWREPRFATWDFGAHWRNRVFKLVEYGGADLPHEFNAFTIVRDSPNPDTVSPANVINGLDLSTGAGSFQFKFVASDEYNRPLTAYFTAEVFKDVGISETLVESATATVNIGISPALETEFLVEFTFANAFKSDGLAPGVGFVNSRIKVSGRLEVLGGIDPGFVHYDFEEIYLVQEKLAPTIEVFLDISTFSLNQTQAQRDLFGEARFEDVLIVVLQDRTVASREFDWPIPTADEVKGLITGYIPASGLFNDVIHAPDVKIWGPSPNDFEYVGFRAELSSGPILEDPSLSPNLPQRYTYFYDIIFDDPTTAFDLVTTTTNAYPRIRIPAYDRSGNQALTYSTLTLTRDASPYMRDGATSWLSIDTRVFKIKNGQSKFGTTISSNPNAFITNVVNNLNAGTTGADTFENLPEDQSASVLEYSTTVGGTAVYNFALAKIRLQGTSGASAVRAFFRLFSYSATNLVFDGNTAYRSTTAATKIPLLGYSSLTAGSRTISIPFFATSRVAHTAATTAQTDPLNVKNFPSGIVTEQVLYFGVYLDINQNLANTKVPLSYIPAHPDGPYTAPEVHPIRNIIRDAHQCMVVEIKFDGNPTLPGDSPASSSNLAQRNLLILETDNPGSPPTHTVQHSFHVDLRKSVADKNGINIPWTAPPLITQYARDKLISAKAVNLRWAGDKRTDPKAVINGTYPLVYGLTSTAVTTNYFDELLIKWPSRPALPKGTRAQFYFPNFAVSRIINLRNVRHAPSTTVKIVDAHTIELVVPYIPQEKQTIGGVTYIPIPYENGDKLETAGIVTLFLPTGIVEGQKWVVDIVQIRGSSQKVLGGFQVKVNTTKAKHGEMLDADTRLLGHLYTRLSLTPKDDIWYKVLQKRVVDTRARCVALSETTGVRFVDPTTDPKGNYYTGRNIRVVLDQLQYSGRSGTLYRFQAYVKTTDNSGKTNLLYFPAGGSISANGCNLVLKPNLVLFEGYVSTNLYVEVRANKTYTELPQLTQQSCACTAFCYPGQICVNSVCQTSYTTELPVYSKTLTGDVDTFPDVYSSSKDYPATLKEWGVTFHIEYL